ncbi:MAG TPA: tetratricopeptide repeat protein [Longimicrobium sp.]|nr:tetratricopeptide repeat protein [Longimicrobium sp.]
MRLNPRLGDDVYFRMGNIHYKRMERQQAVELWRRALEINPQNSVVRTNLELVESVLR